MMPLEPLGVETSEVEAGVTVGTVVKEDASVGPLQTLTVTVTSINNISKSSKDRYSQRTTSFEVVDSFDNLVRQIASYLDVSTMSVVEAYACDDLPSSLLVNPRNSRAS